MMHQMLQLLKASFSSTNVLNDVFGKYCENPKGGSSKCFFFQQKLFGFTFGRCFVMLFSCH
jgi:hypothetical protein